MKPRYFIIWLIVCGITLLILPTISAAAANNSVISTGTGHTLAIKKDGSLWAWGRNDYGQLGLGNTSEQHSPTRVGSVNDWVAAVMSGEGVGACCWGRRRSKRMRKRRVGVRSCWNFDF